MAKFDQLHLTGPKYTEWMLIAEYPHFYHLARLRKMVNAANHPCYFIR